MIKTIKMRIASRVNTITIRLELLLADLSEGRFSMVFLAVVTEKIFICVINHKIVLSCNWR